MARKRSRNPRDIRVIASPRLGLRPLAPPTPYPVSPPLPEFSDRRRHHPAKPHIRHHGLRVPSLRRKRLSPFLGFEMPLKLNICVRRKIRREIMFARGGAGSRKMRKPRRSYYSNVRC